MASFYLRTFFLVCGMVALSDARRTATKEEKWARPNHRVQGAYYFLCTLNLKMISKNNLRMTLVKVENEQQLIEQFSFLTLNFRSSHFVACLQQFKCNLRTPAFTKVYEYSHLSTSLQAGNKFYGYLLWLQPHNLDPVYLYSSLACFCFPIVYGVKNMYGHFVLVYLQSR